MHTLSSNYLNKMLTYFYLSLLIAFSPFVHATASEDEKSGKDAIGREGSMQIWDVLPPELCAKVNTLTGHGQEIFNPNNMPVVKVALLQKDQFLRLRDLKPAFLGDYLQLAKDHGVTKLGPIILNLCDYASACKTNKFKVFHEKNQNGLGDVLDYIESNIAYFSSVSFECTQVVCEGVWDAFLEDLGCHSVIKNHMTHFSLSVSSPELLVSLRKVKMSIEGERNSQRLNLHCVNEQPVTMAFDPKKQQESLMTSFQKALERKGYGAYLTIQA